MRASIRDHLAASAPADARPRRRVLLLTQDLEVWGAQRQIVELAKGLDPTRWDVRLGALESGGPLADELVANGLSVESFPRHWRWDLSPVARLAGYLRREAIDVVHSFLFLPNFYARIAGTVARTPAIVSSLRGTGIEGRPRYALDVATCVLCDRMIANSEAGRDDYLRHGGLRSRLLVVRNGLGELALPPGVTPETAPFADAVARFHPRIGMVGALEERKDQALLIRAFARVAAHHPTAGLVLAGEGAERPRLEALARSLGVAERVLFLGRVRYPGLLYPLLDIYVQASRFGEGMSNSIAEAMLHGLPVVATDVGGNREVVADGDTGRVVPAGDVDALASAIEALVADADGRARLGNAGRARARESFGLATMVAKTAAVYEDVLAHSARRRHGIGSPPRTTSAATSRGTTHPC